MKESAPLTAAELEAAKAFFAKNPMIGQTHIGRMSQCVNAPPRTSHSTGTARPVQLSAAVAARPATAATKTAQ